MSIYAYDPAGRFVAGAVASRASGAYTAGERRRPGHQRRCWEVQGGLLAESMDEMLERVRRNAGGWPYRLRQAEGGEDAPLDLPCWRVRVGDHRPGLGRRGRAGWFIEAQEETEKPVEPWPGRCKRTVPGVLRVADHHGERPASSSGRCRSGEGAARVPAGGLLDRRRPHLPPADGTGSAILNRSKAGGAPRPGPSGPARAAGPERQTSRKTVPAG